MYIDRSKCVAFSGHRTHKLFVQEPSLFASDISLEEQVETEIVKIIDLGYTTFLCGMAEGFDMLAAECVLRVSRDNKEVKLISIIPFRKQNYKFTEEDKKRYSDILERCHDSIVLSEHYFVGCYNVRNDFLIENASVIITNFNGTKGGTEYTVKRAIKHNREVILVS